MTTLNNDELEMSINNLIVEQVGALYAKRLTGKLVQLIATHDQQLLEAILEGKETYTVTEWGEPVDKDAVPVEHIKSVFEMEGE